MVAFVPMARTIEAPGAGGDEDILSAPTGDVAEGSEAEGGDSGAAETSPEADGAPGSAAAGSGEKSGDGVKPKPPAAEIELKLPDGYKADDAQLGKFRAAAKEAGLDSAKAQRLFDLQVEARKADEAALDAELAAERAGWVKSLRDDTDFGGEAFKGNVEAARRAYAKVLTDADRKAIEEAGLANYPPLVRAMAAVGRADAEDSVGRGGRNGAPSQQGEDAILRKRFPTMYTSEG
ncbi:MAG: hypothetical protein ACRD4T_00205 [Candidatus Acidiferrales bacterium]